MQRLLRVGLWACVLLVAWAAGLRAGAALASTSTVRQQPNFTIILADEPIPAERTAAEELADYLGQATGSVLAVLGESTAEAQAPRIYVGPTRFARQHGLDPATWGPEQWAMRSVGHDLVLVGGRPRGTIYAVYRFLEDVVGVRWWNPFEQDVPKRPGLQIGGLDRQGQPRFGYRDIHRLYANDGGRFAARNRLNGQGGAPIDTAYGSGVYFGPPGSVHTFYAYIPPQKYFATHPEWFSLIGGKRTAEHAQLCLSNAELRAAIVDKLKGYIEQARSDAQRAGRPAPVDFDISQNDWGGMCQCEACQAVAQREGSESGPLVDFLNHVADAIREAYPNVRINTLAYQMTEDPPRTLRPCDTIIPRLCDTNANLLQPITHPDNRPFAERLATWGRITKALRIWDYAVTYTPHYGLPLPTVHTYATDYRYYAEHNVEGVFTEHEYPILADLRDLKIWMMIKLLEDPYRDDQALLEDFTDGFYGPAGPTIRRWLAELQTAAERTQSKVDWFPSLGQYKYLTLDLLRQGQALFDEAERLVADDAVRMRRVRHARLPLDRACLVLWPRLLRQWAAQDGPPDKMPLDRDAIADRCRQTWYAQIDLRFPESQRASQRALADAELAPLVARRAYVPLPEELRGRASKDVLDLTAEVARNWQDRAKKISDPDADCGITNRLELSDEDMAKYKLPMPWGVYDPKAKRGLGSATIRPENVPGPGYHWYKLGPCPITTSAYVWFFWSWIIQFPLDFGPDEAPPDQPCEVWARIKFEGPGFPHGAPDQKNAIAVERVLVVKPGRVLESPH